MTEQFQIVFIFASVIIGVISAAYFYVSAGIFMDFLKWPIKVIAAGMFVITIGVLLAAYISYESSLGVSLLVRNIPFSAIFYVVYIVGSVMIAIGARGLKHRPSSKNNVVDVSLGKIV